MMGPVSALPGEQRDDVCKMVSGRGGRIGRAQASRAEVRELKSNDMYILYLSLPSLALDTNTVITG